MSKVPEGVTLPAEIAQKLAQLSALKKQQTDLEAETQKLLEEL